MLVKLCLLVVAVIHLLPLAGLFGVERLRDLYGITLDSPSAILLMQHRAVLFGLLGSVLLLAIAWPVIRPVALAAAWISVVSFIVLAFLGGPVNEQVQRVLYADYVALACLVVIAIHSFVVGRGETLA